MSINVLSLFDGMSCGRIALERADIEVGTYYASEIDKWAEKVSEANYPDIVRLGDVTKWREWDVDWGSIDLLIGGSPCQGFSFAGKQLAFNDPRSALFFEFVNILTHIRKFNSDVKFMLENVRMKKEYLSVIDELLGVEGVMINSSLVSAQNRVRFYWANWELEQPEDEGVVFNDISETPGEYVKISKKGVYKKFQDKLSCLTGGGNSGGNHSDMDLIGKKLHHIGNATNIKGNESIKRIYAQYGKVPCFSTCQGGHRQPKVALNDYEYRRLTPLEFERGQTVPDNYTASVSNTQRYKMLGNGWTVDIIAHIFKEMKNEF